eukprot:2196141-Amphidinium_carterae.1
MATHVGHAVCGDRHGQDRRPGVRPRQQGRGVLAKSTGGVSAASKMGACAARRAAGTRGAHILRAYAHGGELRDCEEID